MTDPTTLFGTTPSEEPVSTDPPASVEGVAVEEEKALVKESSYHCIPSHPVYGMSLLVLSKYHCDVMGRNGTIVVQKGHRVANLRGLTAAGIPLGASMFKGTPEDLGHWLQSQGIPRENVLDDGVWAPQDYALLMHNMSIPGGTPPVHLHSLIRTGKTIMRNDGATHFWEQWTMMSYLFPEVSFPFAGPKIPGSQLTPHVQRHLAKEWWAAFNRKFAGTQVITTGGSNSSCV